MRQDGAAKAGSKAPPACGRYTLQTRVPSRACARRCRIICSSHGACMRSCCQPLRLLAAASATDCAVAYAVASYQAEHLASIFGTEKDRVNCPFFFKIGSCRCVRALLCGVQRALP